MRTVLQLIVFSSILYVLFRLDHLFFSVIERFFSWPVHAVLFLCSLPVVFVTTLVLTKLISDRYFRKSY